MEGLRLDQLVNGEMYIVYRITYYDDEKLLSHEGEMEFQGFSKNIS